MFLEGVTSRTKSFLRDFSCWTVRHGFRSVRDVANMLRTVLQVRMGPYCCSHTMFGQSLVIQFGASWQIIVVAEVCQSFRVASHPSCSAGVFVTWSPASVIIMSLSLLCYVVSSTSVRCKDSRTDFRSCACVVGHVVSVSWCRPVETVAHWSRKMWASQRKVDWGGRWVHCVTLMYWMADVMEF